MVRRHPRRCARDLSLNSEATRVDVRYVYSSCSGGWHDRRSSDEEHGFTLVEVVIAIAVSALILLALGVTLGGALKGLGAQKNRVRANDVAAAAIEDLQRLDYGQLGHCASTSPAPTPFPAGIRSSDIVYLESTHPACGNPVAEPCTPTSGTGLEPSYSCQPEGRAVVYDVRRFVVWNDPGRSEKRVAVYVDWDDSVGSHNLVQQSVLKPPVERRPEGSVPPSFTSTGVSLSSALPVETVNGIPSGSESVTFTATTTGLTLPGDKVYVTLLTSTADGGSGRGGIALSSTDGLTWQGTLNATSATNAGILLGKGSQHPVFTAERRADGRVSSKVAPTLLRFCPVTPDPDTVGCAATDMPTIGTASVPTAPTTATQPGGKALTNDPQVRASTTNLVPGESVSFTVVTTAGAVQVPMTAGAGCTASSCTWTGTLSRASGYLFPAGVQTIYVTGVKTSGATVAASAGDVTF